MNRKLGIAIWTITFTLSVFLILVIPNHYSVCIWTTLVFDAIAYISSLALWMNLFRNANTPADVFYCSPTITVSTAYLVIQLILCIVVGFMVDTISFKMTLVLNIVLMAVVWFLILTAIIAKGHSQRVDSRQKDHHVEL